MQLIRCVDGPFWQHRIFRRAGLEFESDILTRVQSRYSGDGRMGRIFFDFHAKLSYYHAKSICFFAVIRPPDHSHQPCMCNGLAFVTYQDSQDIELLGSQMHSLTANKYDSFFEINTQFREFDLCNQFIRTEAPQRSANPRAQFFHGKGFHNVIVCSRIERLHFVLLRTTDRQHDDRTVEGQTDFAAGFQPAHTRHIHSQEDEVGTLLNHCFDGVVAILGLDDSIAGAGQSSSQYTADLAFVVDNENCPVVYLIRSFL